MLCHEIHHVHIDNEIEVAINSELCKCQFQSIFWNWNILFINKKNNLTKGGLVDKIYLEGTMSQIPY